MSKQHTLKIHPKPLADLLSGAKTCEVRRNDRDFQVGDTVLLMEVNPDTGNWTGAADHVRTISHIQTGYGLPDEVCVLSYAQAEQQSAQAGDDLPAGYRLVQGDEGEPWYVIYPGQEEPDSISYRERDWAITAAKCHYRAALATQPADSEPVAWVTRSLAGANKGEMFLCDPKEPGHPDMWAKPFPVYAAPPEPLDPAAWIVESPKGLEPVTSVCKRKDLADRFASAGWAVTPVYTAPPAAAHGDDPEQWSDQQVRNFLATALRHVDVKGTLHCQDIRDGFRVMREQAVIRASGDERP